MTKAQNAPKAFAGLVPTLTPIAPTKSPYKPSKGLLKGFAYTPAAKTDVQATWRRFGWKPVHEQE